MTLSFISAFATLLAVVPMSPSTSGGWTTYLTPHRYSDLLVKGDTVWCSTREAGLLLYRRSAQSFTAITRSPNGLAGNELTALAYDRSGRLWIGTNGAGLSRMSADGSSWSLINAFDGLPADSVNCLRAEGDTIWVGTPRGIAFWNGKEIAGVLPSFGQPSPFASDDITGIVVHPDTIWVSTGQGIYLSKRSTGLANWVSLNTGLLNTQIGALVTNDTLLFCQAGGRAYTYVNNQWVMQGYTGNMKRLFDDGGVVTASTDLGLYRLCNGGWATLNTEAASSFTDPSVWIPASDGAGLYLAANQTGLIEQPAAGVATGWPVFTPDAPPDNDIRNLNLDSGRVWVNSAEQGVGRLTGDQWRIWPDTPSPCSGYCDTTFIEPLYAWALLVDREHKKWIANWEFALEEIDDSNPTPQFIHHTWPDSLRDRTRMWSSAADSDGGRWFGGDTPDLGVIPASGLLEFDSLGVLVANFRNENQSGVLNSKIHGLTVTRDHVLFVGYPNGAQWVQLPLGPNGMHDATPMTDVSRLDVQGLVARGDTLWMLTTQSLRRYKLTPITFQVEYTIPEATALFAGNPLAVGPDGSPWVGTEAGVRVYHSNGTSEDFNIENSPIAGNQVYAIRVDPVSGVAWISTSSGMNRYDPHYAPPPPPRVPQLSFLVYPNPIALNKTGLQLRIKGNGTAYEGVIFDLRGRKVKHFNAPANHSVIWDGTDDDGQTVRPGIYFVHANAGGSSATVRVAVLR